jgi:hypothetical protein
MALQEVGESTCSLGEARHRADLVVYWGSNPLVSHPRHMERYGVEPRGAFVAGGRSDRHLVVIDTRPSETSAIADTFIQVAPDRDFELLWTLGCLVRGVAPESYPECGVARDEIERLAERLRTCHTGVVFFGTGMTQGDAGHRTVEALLRLVTDLNRTTRFYARRMRVYGDVAGADSVLCWQTGFPFSVNLARGYPRYNPGEYSANDVLRRAEAEREGRHIVGIEQDPSVLIIDRRVAVVPPGVRGQKVRPTVRREVDVAVRHERTRSCVGADDPGVGGATEPKNGGADKRCGELADSHQAGSRVKAQIWQRICKHRAANDNCTYFKQLNRLRWRSAGNV